MNLSRLLYLLMFLSIGCKLTGQSTINSKKIENKYINIILETKRWHDCTYFIANNESTIGDFEKIINLSLSYPINCCLKKPKYNTIPWLIFGNLKRSYIFKLKINFSNLSSEKLNKVKLICDNIQKEEAEYYWRPNDIIFDYFSKKSIVKKVIKQYLSNSIIDNDMFEFILITSESLDDTEKLILIEEIIEIDYTDIINYYKRHLIIISLIPNKGTNIPKFERLLYKFLLEIGHL